MPVTEMIVLVIGLVSSVVVLAGLATRFGMPSTIVLVLGGIGLSFVPGIPAINLDPDLVLFLFLPPLIYASAWQTSWREFRAVLQPILWLAIGLVLVSTTLVALIGHYGAGLSWGVAFVLGALVSPTDAVAATATAQRLGLARRLVTLLEGESMVNDATGLVVYRFAVTAVVSGVFSLGTASVQFLLVSGGGLLLGLVLSWPIAWLHRVLDDGPMEMTITLVTPFVAYLCAEALHVSGVLAVLAAGLYLSRRSARFFSSTTRLQVYAVWEVLVFLLNGVLFLLIGLQLHRILTAMAAQLLLLLLRDATVICLAVILTRIAWVFAATSLSRWLTRSGGRRDREESDWRTVLLIGWAGIRGGLSLAAALALPVTITGGTAFPDRELLIFLTFCVIIATLVVQGLGLVPLVRWLGLQSDPNSEQEVWDARKAAIRAALHYLDTQTPQTDLPEPFLDDLRLHYEEKLRRVAHHLEGTVPENDGAVLHQLRRGVIAAERTAVIQLRDQGRIADDVLRTIERELDLEDQRTGSGHAPT